MGRWVCTSAALLVIASRFASAQTANAQAEALFNEGLDLLNAGKTAEACQAFEASQKLDPAISTLLRLADCREKNNQLATAWGLFLEAERQTRSDDKGANKTFHQIALDHATKLQPRVSKLTIKVAPENKVDHLEILRGDELVDPSAWGNALPIDGGTYKITARAPSFTPWSDTVTVSPEGDSKLVEVPKLTAAVAPPPKDVPAPKEEVSHRTSWILAGGALVAGGAAVGFDLWGDSIYNQSKVEPDSKRQLELWHSANLRRYVAEGFGVAGVACAGIAVWLYFRTQESDRDTQALVVPLGRDAAAIVWTGRFQ